MRHCLSAALTAIAISSGTEPDFADCIPSPSITRNTHPPPTNPRTLPTLRPNTTATTPALLSILHQKLQYKMSSNVGLSTPRGSGTSGYVQRANLAHMKPRDHAAPYPADPRPAAQDAPAGQGTSWSTTRRERLSSRSSSWRINSRRKGTSRNLPLPSPPFTLWGSTRDTWN